MNCCRCGRPMRVNANTVTVTRGSDRYLWGPRCALLAGLVKPKRGKTKPPTPGRARAFAGQLDWIETTEEGIEA